MSYAFLDQFIDEGSLIFNLQSRDQQGVQINSKNLKEQLKKKNFKQASSFLKNLTLTIIYTNQKARELFRQQKNNNTIELLKSKNNYSILQIENLMESSLQKIEKLYLLLLNHNVDLFPQGLENSQEKVKELIEILKQDQEFNDNLQKEVNQFLAIDPQKFRQVLNYDQILYIKKEYDIKIVEQTESQEKIGEAQKKIQEIQKEILNNQAFIHNYFISDKNRVQLMDDAFLQLNQIKAQAIQEIQTLDKYLIAEARAYWNPPHELKQVTQMIDILLNNMVTQNDSWKETKLLLADPSEFLRKINKFKIEDIKQNSIRLARIIFENLNSSLCSKCTDFTQIMYKWAQYQFQISDLLDTYQIDELIEHKKALLYQENIKDFQQQISNLETTISKYQEYNQLFNGDQVDKATQVIATVKQFDQLQIMIKPQQYGINITNFLIKFLSQYYHKSYIDSLIDEIFTNIFVNYTILYDETPQQPYKYPIIINKLINQNQNFDIVAHQMLILLKNPIQFYNNLKLLNYLIDKVNLTHETNSLVNQIYLNYQTYSEQFLQEIIKLIHQSLILIPNQIEFNLHLILKILNENKTERMAVIGIIDYIQRECNIYLQYQTQMSFQGKPLLDYLINTFINDNQNKNNFKFNEQQLVFIKNIIIKKKLEIDETVKNIIYNYQIIQDHKVYYCEVNKEIQSINKSITNNKRQIESLEELILKHNQIFNKLRLTYLDLLTEIKYLEDQLKILKDKDRQLIYQIDQSKQILNRPIHFGIKRNELGYFKYLSKFNPISYFASKIVLIQLGIYSFTPDMIKKHLGSQSSLKILSNLNINHLNEDQFQHLSKLLIAFNEEMSLSKFQTQSIQNLIIRSFRIFHMKQLRTINNQIIVLRSDLLQKQREIRNRLYIIYNLKSVLDQKVLSQQEEGISSIRDEIQQIEIQELKTQSNDDQLKDLQQLQELIDQFDSFDTTNLSIQLYLQNFKNPKEQELQINNQDQPLLFYLTCLQYQYIPNGFLKYQSRFNLLLIYLQDQYRNNQAEFKSKYENKGLFNQFDMPILVDALSYWNYYKRIAKANINILIGICSYQLFYNERGHQLQAICIQFDHNQIDYQANTNQQIRYGRSTLAVIMQFLQQVIDIQQKINSIHDILNYKIITDAQNEIEFKDFQQEVQGMFNFQIREIVI